jgi:hypothetical protein
VKIWAEKLYPYGLALALGLGSLFTPKLSILSAPRTGKILDDVLILSAIALGFWGTAATLLLAIDDRSIVRRLKRGQHFRTLVGYSFEAIASQAALAILTVVASGFSDHLAAAAKLGRLFEALWIASLGAAAGATFRGYHVLAKVLRIAASEGEGS